jgi:hypothetical protein
MRDWTRIRRMFRASGALVVGGAVGALGAPAVAGATSLHPTLLTKSAYGAILPGFARTADGTLHVVYETNKGWGDSAYGIGTVAISPSGHVHPAVQALAWGTSPSNGIPGVAVMPNGALEAVFGGSPGGDPGPWGISSSDRGSTWTAPADVGSGSMEGGGAMNLEVSGATPVLTESCCGGIVVQDGFGSGASTSQIVNSSDGNAGIVSSALDASSGAVVDSWDSVDNGGGVWLQQVAPTLGAAFKMPIPSQYGTGNPLPIAGRDTGPGVFATYPANHASTTQMRLLRYQGGSVAVGSVKGLQAQGWGTATGLDGRIWSIWYGTVAGKGTMAVTRSNEAVTRFEPIQQYRFNWSGLTTFTGDGRLGPLDLLFGGTPGTKVCCGIQGIYYARVLPEMSSSISVKKLGGGKFKLSARVRDAGDVVSGATVKAKGDSAVTGATGDVSLTIKGKAGKHVHVTVTHLGYRVTAVRVRL